MSTEIRSCESGNLIAVVEPPPAPGSYIKLVLDAAYMGFEADADVYLEPTEADRLALALRMASR